jgi:hypothetical protein
MFRLRKLGLFVVSTWPETIDGVIKLFLKKKIGFGFSLISRIAGSP